MKAVRGCLVSVLLAWRSILLIEVILIALVGVYGWQSGWRDMSEYTSALMLAGVGVIAAGSLSLMGGYNSTRDVKYMVAASAGPDDFSKTLKRGAEYNRQNFSCFALLGIAGIFAFVLSLIGLALFG
ncbi:MAG: hypothetical protein HY866_19605 [Chloroflexi bacterium]|nr:hypothetical protein [Chloroflexota bacterium]